MPAREVIYFRFWAQLSTPPVFRALPSPEPVARPLPNTEIPSKPSLGRIAELVVLVRPV